MPGPQTQSSSPASVSRGKGIQYGFNLLESILGSLPLRTPDGVLRPGTTGMLSRLKATNRVRAELRRGPLAGEGRERAARSRRTDVSLFEHVRFRAIICILHAFRYCRRDVRPLNRTAVARGRGRRGVCGWFVIDLWGARRGSLSAHASRMRLDRRAERRLEGGAPFHTRAPNAAPSIATNPAAHP